MDLFHCCHFGPKFVTEYEINSVHSLTLLIFNYYFFFVNKLIKNPTIIFFKGKRELTITKLGILFNGFKKPY